MDTPRPLACLMALLVALAPASAEPPAPGEASDLAAFLDGLIGEHPRAARAPGVVMVVRDSRILLARGWGQVDPERTLFRLGRLTSLFTTLAALRLVESGQLALDQEVDPELPGVTVRHLMTHTSGLGERYRGALREPGQVGWDLADFLAEGAPPRLHPPGRVYRFSAWATARLGLALEQAAGVPYARAVEQAVLGPLGLERARFGPGPDLEATPPAPGLWDPLSGDPVASPTWELRALPADGLRATGREMAVLMIALLRGGDFYGRRLLSPESVATLTARQFTPHPALPGVGLGLWRGPGTLGLESDLPPYGARLVLAPELGLGVFAACTSWSGQDLVRHLSERLLARLRPAPAPPASVPGTSPPPPCEGLAGVYRDPRFPHHELVAAPLVLGPTGHEVLVLRLGEQLRLLHPAAPLGAVLHPLGEDLWQVGEGPGRVALRRDDAGGVVGLVLPGDAPVEYERVAWNQFWLVQLGLLAGYTLFFLWVGPFAAARRAYQRFQHGSLAEKFLGRPVELPYVVRGVAATGALLLLAQPWIALLPLRGGLPSWGFGVPLGVTLAALGGHLMLLAGLALIPLGWRLLREPLRPRPERLAFLASTVALLAFVKLAAGWNLLGWPG